MKRLLQIFQSKYATVFCIIFAIANRIIFTTLYSEIGKDAKVQITLAKNFLEGKGLGITKYFAADLNTPVFDKYQLFPPGFTFSIMPLLRLFDNDEYKAVLAFDIITIVFFVFAVRLLGKKAGLPLAFINILTIIAGCFQYPFLMSGSSSDTIGLTLLLFGLSIVILIIERPKQLKLINLFLYSLVFFLPSFFRYMYLPVSVSFAAIIFAYGAYYKNRSLKNTGLKFGGFVIFFISLMLFLSSWYNGNSVHVVDTGRGLFFDQLLHWYPYIPASFINLDFIAQLIARITNISYTDAFKIFELVNIILLLVLLSVFLRYLFYFKKKQLYSSSVFIICGSIISFCILFLLAYFSLTYKPQLYGIYWWNYNYESRYFAFIFIFLPMLLLICIHLYPSLLKKLLSRVIFFTAFCILFAEVIHGVYYNIKIVAGHKDIAAIRNRVADFRQFPSMIKELKVQYPGYELLICSPDQFYLNAGSEMGYKTIFDYTTLNTINLHVEKKSILLFPVHETDVWRIKDYLERKKPRLLAKIAGTAFYLEEIDSY